MNISKIKNLIPAPESAFHIELSNDNSQVNCDFNGSPIAGAVYESSVISLWYGGNDAWSQFNVTVESSGISHGYNAIKHSMNPRNITKDTATITVTARHKTRKNVVLNATYTITKNKAGYPGETPVSYSLKPSLHVIRKGSDGTLLDTQISFEVHKIAGTVLTVISTFDDLYGNALDIKIGSTYIGDASKGNTPITVPTADFWLDNDKQLVRLEHESDSTICYDSESIGVVTDGENGQSAADGMFVPAIIWVEADENGWSVGEQTFNVSPSVIIEGVPSDVEANLTILSSPAAVTASYDIGLGLIEVSIPDGIDPVEYQGEVKVKMEAISEGKIYPVVKGIPIVANKKGEQGDPGQDGVTYEIIPSVSSIRSDENGNILTGVITVTAYKTKSGSRTSCGLGMAFNVGPDGGEVDHYWAQYRIDNGSWTNCVNISTGPGVLFMEYGVPGSAVSSITSGIDFRLLYGTSSSFSVVHRIAPIQVVKDGKTGQRGKTGRYYYYDGYFDRTKEYKASDNQAPYIAFDWEDNVSVNGVYTKVTKTSYYMLIAETNKPNGTYISPRTDEATGVWELMETSFKWIIAEAIFINFAKLGAAIFSGDWMISQHGTINGEPSTDYTKFDANDPDGNDEGNFRPNYAVDLLTGEAWLNSAHIRGVVYATSGKFTGEIESEAGHIGGFNIGTSNLTAMKGALNITPNGVEFRPSNGSVAWLGATDNVIGAFYAKMLSNYSFACGAQFGAEGASKLNAAIDITKGVVSGYAPIVMEFSTNITIVCDNDVKSDLSSVKHVRSGGVFLPVGNNNLTVTLPLSPENGTQYTFIKTNQANTVISPQGTNKICVNQKYQDAASSYTLVAYARLTLIYLNGYWYGNT